MSYYFSNLFRSPHYNLFHMEITLKKIEGNQQRRKTRANVPFHSSSFHHSGYLKSHKKERKSRANQHSPSDSAVAEHIAKSRRKRNTSVVHWNNSKYSHCHTFHNRFTVKCYYSLKHCAGRMSRFILVLCVTWQISIFQILMVTKPQDCIPRIIQYRHIKRTFLMPLCSRGNKLQISGKT